MKDNQTKGVIIGILIVGVLCIAGISFAYFAARIIGEGKPMTINAGKMELIFSEPEEGNEINLTNAKPGDSAEKKFNVKNNSTVDTTFTYNIKLTNLKVTFEQKDLEYTITEYEDDTYELVKGEPITGFISNKTVNKGEMYLAVGIEAPAKTKSHYYKLKIEFKNLPDVNQNYNQGAEFNGTINVDDNGNAELYIPNLLDYCKSGEQLNECLDKIVDDTTNVSSLSNIINDETEQNNSRYAGADTEVNNYIWFNCDDYSLVTDAASAQTQNCEKWRIIGLFKEVPKLDGSSEDLVKIIRADSVGGMAWDETEGNSGSNNWTRPADLKTSLENYYNGSQLGNANGINQGSTRPMIEEVTWNIGGHNTGNATASQFYGYERGETVPREAEATWNGYIGLMYPSDYGYATTGSNGGSEDRAACLATKLSSYYSNSNCYEKDWLYITTGQWTLTPYSSNRIYVFIVAATGYVHYSSAINSNAVRPSLYLKADVKIADEGGNGSEQTPYILDPSGIN